MLTLAQTESALASARSVTTMLNELQLIFRPERETEGGNGGTASPVSPEWLPYSPAASALTWSTFDATGGPPILAATAPDAFNAVNAGMMPYHRVNEGESVIDAAESGVEAFGKVIAPPSWRRAR